MGVIKHAVEPETERSIWKYVDLGPLKCNEIRGERHLEANKPSEIHIKARRHQMDGRYIEWGFGACAISL